MSVHLQFTKQLYSVSCEFISVVQQLYKIVIVTKYYLLNITQCIVLIIMQSETSYKMSPNNLRLLMPLNSYG